MNIDERIEPAPYSSAWPAAFPAEAARIRRALSDAAGANLRPGKRTDFHATDGSHILIERRGAVQAGGGATAIDANGSLRFPAECGIAPSLPAVLAMVRIQAAALTIAPAAVQLCLVAS
ncbi:MULTISPECIES: hypothetical protein [unclassified Burkholderia]|uniref:hypothetical protein n=1 Tax=unclassified Burkholderia TaxID=2613784 RepID=UPI000F567AB5|nr:MULTISPECIES: hypothetical protein [unclassified Burkholderia]